MSKFLTAACLGALLWVSAPAPAAAQSPCGWDLATDWSEVANPNGPWSYNAGASPIAVHQPNWGNYGNPAWAGAASGSGAIPGWARLNASGASQMGPDCAQSAIVMHCNDPASGNDVDLANVTWTSPVAGLYTVHCDVWHTDLLARGVIWRLLHNGTLLDSGQLDQGDPFDSFAPRSGSFTRVFAIGDVVRLEFERAGALGAFCCARLAITPGTLFLAGPARGAAGLLNRILVRGATPGMPVILAYAAAPGSAAVQGCPGTVTCLQSPKILAQLTADGAGRAAYTTQIPSRFAGRTIFLQAVDRSACSVSNLVLHTF